MTEFIGPFPEYYIASIDGYQVPQVTLHPLGEKDNFRVNVILQNHAVMAEDEEEARKWLPMIAHALAIGGGYTCHGEHSRRFNPHAVKIMRVGSMEKESTDGEKE